MRATSELVERDSTEMSCSSKYTNNQTYIIYWLLLQVKGSVTFNGHTHEEFVPQKTAMYVSQNDLHNGQLTVRETLEFSARTQGVGTQYRESHLLLQRASESTLGLSICFIQSYYNIQEFSEWV